MSDGFHTPFDCMTCRDTGCKDDELCPTRGRTSVNIFRLVTGLEPANLPVPKRVVGAPRGGVRYVDPCMDAGEGSDDA